MGNGWMLYLILGDGTRRFRHWNGTSYEYRDVKPLVLN